MGQAPPQDEAKAAIKVLVFLISFLSFGNFNPALLGASEAAAETAQKLAVLALWMVAVFLTFLPGVQRKPPATTGLPQGSARCAHRPTCRTCRPSPSPAPCSIEVPARDGQSRG